ncbi:hypothetical protein SAMN02745119_03003 [Trichlorobacter thiogenes]|uniref:Uncharacterized protein n=1 Tax=Trichlorobacter thiogenes TaxID=115783 RepID=A0A1T4RPS9_9BACT|nr:hypothetical protein [Trichlorobacter thiogenes]SKA17974.1 hypothetical protein SAMN02745119_03003 [Trichlorobacter thiogenes]
MIRTTALTVSFIAAVATAVLAAETAPVAQPVVTTMHPLEVTSKPHQCELPRCLTLSLLQQRKLAKFHQAMDDIKGQRALIGDFERYAAWMNTNLASYSRYIQAGSAAATVAKFLPIPYAGQAAFFSKFVAQFTLSLGSTSKSLNSYLQASQQLINQASALDPNQPDPKALADVHAFADGPFLKSMLEAQHQLNSIADLSASAQAFLVGLNNYLSTGDEYLHKVKGVFKKKEDSQQEKSFLTESSGNLKTQTELFNTRLKTFETQGVRITNTIKALAVYDELAGETGTAPPAKL